MTGGSGRPDEDDTKTSDASPVPAGQEDAAKPAAAPKAANESDATNPQTDRAAADTEEKPEPTGANRPASPADPGQPAPDAPPAFSASRRPSSRSAISSRAADALRVSFHSNAGRITRPRSSRTTMPCCWPPTLRARTSLNPPAASAAARNACHQASGSTSVPSG